jgi:hypothetical protein
MTLHVTEAELAHNLHGILTKVQECIELVIEQNSRPVAVLKAPRRKAREFQR